MTAHTLTLVLPENLYLRLDQAAQAAARPVTEVILQTLAHHLPPAVEDDLPFALRAELLALEALSDEALWTIALGVFNQDKVTLYDALLERQAANTLTPEGREWLTRLREEADALMLRKAHALALLKSRGHSLPAQPEQLSTAA